MRNDFKKELKWLLEEKYNGKINDEAKKDIEKLKRGEQIDYLIGFIPFLNCRIDLSKKPFIPRPETEYWTEKAIEDIKSNPKKKIECLDVFAGSGCIGIAVLKNTKRAFVDFAEIEKENLEQIKINVKLNRINPKRYNIIQSDVFENIIKRYDYIFANPPYVPLKRRNKVQKSVLKSEPLEAVFGGKEGLFYIKKLLKDVKKYLKTEGKIYLEFDSPQKIKISKILSKYGYKNYKFFKDQYGKWRYLVVINLRRNLKSLVLEN